MIQLAAPFAAIDASPGRGPLQPRIRRQRGTAGIQVQLRLNGTQRDALDALVTEVGAPLAVPWRPPHTASTSADTRPLDRMQPASASHEDLVNFPDLRTRLPAGQSSNNHAAELRRSGRHGGRPLIERCAAQ